MARTGLRVIGILLIVGAVGVVGSTALVGMILPEVFSSTVRIIPSATMTDPVLIAREMERIQSGIVLARVVRNLNLDRRFAEQFKTENVPPDLALTILKTRVEVKQAPKTRIVSIIVSGQDKNEAANIANEIAKVYRDLSAGPDGKGAAEIIDRAEPGLRPIRTRQVQSLLISMAVA